MERPDTRYTWSGDFSIAYQVLGEGDANLVHLPAYMANVDANWRVPPLAAFLEELASFCRLIVMDRRGEGCSDRMPPGQAATLEEMVDDVVAVTEAAMCEYRTFLFGAQETGFVAMLAAATHPDRFAGLVLFGCAPTYQRADDVPWQWSEDQWAAQVARHRRSTSAVEIAASYARVALPSLVGDRDVIREIASLLAQTEGLGAVLADLWKFSECDVRQLLPTISVPTLVLHRADDQVEPIDSARYLAGRIPGAQLVELSGRDAQPWAGDSRAVIDEIREFVTGVRAEVEPARRLSTILLTDIVGSTERAASMGDESWAAVMDAHDRVAREIVGRHRGELVRGTGDGMLATFDGPARAVRCAQELVGAIGTLGLEMRAGAHTGEITYGGRDLAGLGVHIAARVASMAGPSEVWASSTVKDLVAGSGLVFEDRGEHDLKGVPDRWHLYRVVG